jgi:hypothetical protein
VDVHFCLFELHTELLARSFVEVTDQQAKHDLFLADDMINSLGDGDLAVGDSLTVFFQSDRPDEAGFSFDVDYSEDRDIRKSLRDITKQRDEAIDAHIENDLNPSDPLKDKPKFTDIPFVQSLANDKIYLNTADNVGVGDFAMIGLVTSAQDVEDEEVQKYALADYFDSIKALRTPPKKSKLKDLLGSHKKIEFYTDRYDHKLEGTEAVTHGDTFVGESSTNAVFGEFLTGFAFKTSQSTGLEIDTKANAYYKYKKAFKKTKRNAALAGDTFDLAHGTKVDGQLGKDTYVGMSKTRRSENSKKKSGKEKTDMDDVILAIAKVFFVDHPLLVQMADDFYNEGIYQSTLTKLKGGSFVPEAHNLFESADADSQ